MRGGRGVPCHEDCNRSLRRFPRTGSSLADPHWLIVLLCFLKFASWQQIIPHQSWCCFMRIQCRRLSTMSLELEPSHRKLFLDDDSENFCRNEFTTNIHFYRLTPHRHASLNMESGSFHKSSATHDRDQIESYWPSK